jgi:hypothetical protein
MDSNSPPLAVVGGGGSGKTTIALQIIYCPAIKAHYYCCFLACDSIHTSTGLVLAILQVLKYKLSDSKDDPMAALSSHLGSFGSLMLVLDNFESSWGVTSIQPELTTVLQILTSFSNVQLIVTMRGDFPPAYSAIQWTTVASPLLSLNAARDLFLSINPRHARDFCGVGISPKHLHYSLIARVILVRLVWTSQYIYHSVLRLWQLLQRQSNCWL